MANNELTDKSLKLYEREVIAREKQAEALEFLARNFYVKALDTEYGIENIAEAVACLVRVVADVSTAINEIDKLTELANAVQEMSQLSEAIDHIATALQKNP